MTNQRPMPQSSGSAPSRARGLVGVLPTVRLLLTTRPIAAQYNFPSGLDLHGGKPRLSQMVERFSRGGAPYPLCIWMPSRCARSQSSLPTVIAARATHE